MTLFEWIVIGLLALIVIEIEIARLQLARRGRQISELVKTSERSVGLVYAIHEHVTLLTDHIRHRDRRADLKSEREAEEYLLDEEVRRLERKRREEENIRDPKATSGRGVKTKAVRRKRQRKEKK